MSGLGISRTAVAEPITVSRKVVEPGVEEISTILAPGRAASQAALSP